MSPETKPYIFSTSRSLSLPDRVRTYDVSYRFIRPEEFADLGIEEQDVPVGTFVAENHPPFLASRFGGNAYGLGIVEHRDKLSGSELEFLERLDINDPEVLSKNYRRLNSIYRKLGLLIRFSGQGKRYFLIPINWISHSLEDIRDKGDEIERILIKQMYECKKEKLTVCLLTAPNDLIVHEVSGRMPSQRFVVLDSIQRVLEARGPFDLMIIPKDINDLLLSLDIQGLSGSSLSQRSFTIYGTYVAGKIYDLLAPAGQLLVIASKPFPRTDKEVWVEFRDAADFRNFLLFTHVFRPKKRYRGQLGNLQRVHLSDFYNYLSGIFIYREDLSKLAGDRDPLQLNAEEIDELPHLDLRISRPGPVNLESRWERVLGPFFERITCHSKLAPSLKKSWGRNYIIESELPDNLQIYVGRRRQPPVRLEQLEQQERASGMAGCSLSLVASYKNSFDYLLAVIDLLNDIRDKRFHRLSELDLNRLQNPFTAVRNRYGAFRHIKQMMTQTSRWRRLESLVNPDDIEGKHTRVLENIEKLGLLGVSPAMLREIYLTVVGHTTMGRITFGKLPKKTLKSITDQVKHQSLEEVVDLLRIIRLMSMAEIAAALGDDLTREHARELFSLYDEAIRVAADPYLDWESFHDQQVAALGGAQNLAVRKILKLCNLFAYLDSWTELTDKGPFQKEAMAQYSEERLVVEIDEVLKLIDITNEVKERFYERDAFSRPYFFRKLLGFQFHGTGHLFPILGTRAAFVLLWITVNASPGNVINFNPLVSYETDTSDSHPVQIRTALESLDLEQLDFEYLANIKEALSQGRPAFIFDSGLQLRYNPGNQVTEVNFVDVAGNLSRLKEIVRFARQRSIPEMQLAEFKEADRLFRELDSYLKHLVGVAGGEGPAREPEARLQEEISNVCAELQQLLAGKLFVPRNLYDNLEILHQHCPNISRRLLSEFWDLYCIKPTQKIHDGETVPDYVLRCVKKFQALVNREREGLLDKEIFYQLAQQQFGPMTGESIGPSNLQIEALEDIVQRLSSRPKLLEALGAALVYQELGKLAMYCEEYRGLSDKVAHARAGAEILKKLEVFRRFGMDSQTAQTAEFLVEVHGLIGHILRGEVAMPALEVITALGDEMLFDSFFLHSVLAAAGFREGVMVEDLLDRFLQVRQVALQIIRGELSWQTYMEGLFVEKGKSLLSVSDRDRSEKLPLAVFSDWRALTDEGALRKKGEETAAVERLFRLVGLADLGFVDVQMKILGMPVSFIYYKRALKSTGVQRFEADLGEALAAYRALMDLEEEARRLVVDKLNPAQDQVRLYGLEYVARHLRPENWLKLLVLAFRASDRYLEQQARPWVVNFQHLCLSIDWRHQALDEELSRLSAVRLFRDNRLLDRLCKASVGLMVRYNRTTAVINFLFQDRFGIQPVVERLRREESIFELKNLYHRELKRLRSRSQPTQDYQNQLSAEFHKRLHGLIERTLKQAEERMRREGDFDGLEGVFHELLSLVEEDSFSDEQVQLVKDMYEFNRDRLRNQRLKEIYDQIDSCASPENLRKIWKKIREELISNRRHLGEEFEALVASRLDERLAELEGC